MTCNDKCIHFPVCEQKNYDFANIDECEYYEEHRPHGELKGHGRLIDADEVVKEICIEYKVNSIYELPNELKSFIKKYLNEAPTILNPTTEYMIKNYAFSKSEG